MGEIRVFRWLRCALIIMVFLPVWAHADFTSEEIKKMHPNKYRANHELTFKSFMEDYESQDSDSIRNASVYLFGVIDATEKKIWCDFWKFKSITVFDILHMEFRKVDKSRYNERAAHVIIGILSNSFPCNKESSK